MIPVTLTEHRAIAHDEYHIVKAGTVLAIDDKKIPVIGCSCDKDVVLARKIAKWELFERVYSHRTYVSKIYSEKKRLTSFNWPQLKETEDVSLDDFLSNLRGIDSTGVAFGPSLHAAAYHAIMELGERVLSYRWWYENTLQLSLLEKRSLANSIELAIYVNRKIPLYCVASLWDISKGIFVCGAALRKTMSESIEKAVQEAIMVHDSLSRSHDPRYSRLEENNRFLNQRSGEYSLNCRKDFLLKIDFNSMRLIEEPFSIEMTIDHIFSDRSIRIIKMHGVNKEYTVKAITVPYMPVLSDGRKNMSTLSDPFF